MLTRRTRLIFALILLVVAALAALAYWMHRHHAGPAIARLLPEGEAILYLDLRPIRLATHFGDKPVTRDPDYDQFVQSTGFQFERDLDQVALVVHRPEVALDQGAQTLERRFSEVFIGRYDPAKLAAYLKSLAATTENISGHNVFVIPHEGRTVRVCLLSNNIVAVSNSSDAGNLRHIVEAFSFPSGSGPTLLRDYAQRLPFTSPVWAIARLTTPDGAATGIPLPGGLNFTLPQGTVTILSLGMTSLSGAQLKAEAITPSAAEAKQLSESVSSFLSLFRAIQQSSQPGGPDPDVKRFFDSLHIEQQRASAILTAEISSGFLKKIMADVPAVESEKEEKQPAPAQKKPAKPSRRSVN